MTLEDVLIVIGTIAFFGTISLVVMGLKAMKSRYLARAWVPLVPIVDGHVSHEGSGITSTLTGAYEGNKVRSVMTRIPKTAERGAKHDTFSTELHDVEGRGSWSVAYMKPLLSRPGWRLTADEKALKERLGRAGVVDAVARLEHPTQSTGVFVAYDARQRTLVHTERRLTSRGVPSSLRYEETLALLSLLARVNLMVSVPDADVVTAGDGAGRGEDLGDKDASTLVDDFSGASTYGAIFVVLVWHMIRALRRGIHRATVVFLARVQSARACLGRERERFVEYVRSVPESFRPANWRNVCALVGFIMMVVGFVLVLPLIYLILTFAWAVLYNHERRFFTGLDQETVLLLTGAGLLAQVAGRTLMSLRRQVALFLRRFGQVEPTRALEVAIDSAMGRSWRLVTLDDRQVAPLGARVDMRRAAVSLQVAVILIPALGMYWASKVYASTHPEPADSATGGSGSITDPLFEGMERLASSALGAAKDVTSALGASDALGNLPGFVVAILVVCALPALRWSLVIVWRVLLAAEWIFPFLSVGNQIRRSEANSRLWIRRKRQIGPVVRGMRRRSRRLLAPQLVVVGVAPALWKLVVLRSAAVSSLVITDVSELSENVLWEIETVMPASTNQWIFVAHQERFESWVAQDAAVPSTSSLAHRLRQVLSDEPLLLYGESPEEMTKFTTALRSTVHEASSTRP